MSKINTPSYASLIPRDRRIKIIQELCNKLNEVESSGGNAEEIEELQGEVESIIESINPVIIPYDGSTVYLQSNTYSTITGLDSLSKDSSVEFAFSTAAGLNGCLFEGSFDTGDDITTSGKRLTIKWPTQINWGSSDLSLSPSTHYEFSIRRDNGNYYGLIHSWPLA